jgi:hypothetical protein
VRIWEDGNPDEHANQRGAAAERRRIEIKGEPWTHAQEINNELVKFFS